LAAAWELAFQRAPGSVFQSFPLARRWIEIFGREFEIEVWSNGSALLPLARHEGGLRPLGEGLFDYVDLIGPPADGSSSGWWEPPAWRQLQITGVRADSPHLAFWRQWAGEGEIFTAAPYRHANGACLDAEHRRAAARWRHAQAEGARLLRLDEPAARQHLLAWILERKAMRLSAQGAATVLGQAECRWLQRMVECEPQLSELWCLQLQERTIAGLLCWTHRKTRYAYTISHDPAFDPLSPGILLLFAVLRLTLEAGWCFDFLTGEQAFKQRFATHRESLWRFRRQRD
jgi:CelD/BcsL family acetyltransferase involved in cellulose biosynthesis